MVARFFAPPFFSFSSLRKKRIAAASEEASSIPFPPGRRKLHIRSLLLPSQIVTVSLGHNLAIWNFTTPHAILMMAVISLPANTAKSKTSMRRKSRARLWSIEGVRGNHPKGFPGLFFLLPDVFFLEKQKENAVRFPFSRKEKEKNGFKNAFNHSLPRFKKSPFSSLARAIPAPAHQPE